MIVVRCPDCGAGMSWEATTCAGGHTFVRQDGVLSLLSARESGFFAARDEALIRFREAAGLRRDDYDFEGLPGSARHEPEWAARCADLSRLMAWAGSSKRYGEVGRALDVGASNGWLSHNLVAAGWDVTAIDLFRDEIDGLAAMNRYRRAWRAIQMDIERCDLLVQRFDLVVMNHGIHFLRDPIALLARLQQRVAPGGLLVALGLRFFRWPERRMRQVNQIRHHTISCSGTDVLNLPSKGLLDFQDRHAIRSLGIKLSLDSNHWRANAAAQINRYRPVHMHGVWRRPL